MKKTYELTYLISPELSEEELKELQAKFVSFIKEEEGILVEEKLPLNKKLAYSVKKQSHAFLAVLIFQLSPEKLANLEKKIKEENRILRYLILVKRVTKEAKAPRIFKKIKIEKPEKEKKVELKEIGKKLEEILGKEE